MGKSQDLYKKAKKIIPGGTQLLSKRPEMFLPNLWPAYYSKAKGCEVWDLDGKRYVDMSHMGVGSCILGYAEKSVDNKVKTAIKNGSMSTLNCPEEVMLARELIKIHKWADMVRYARTGGESMAIAVRIARAKTGKDVILFCGYHGWHDWYLAANLASNRSLDGHLLPGLEPSGVPRSLRGTSIPFKYNDTKQFLQLVRKYKGRIAAVVMEPLRKQYPKPGFLEIIRKITKKEKIVLVFDEITSGWRLALGGAHLKFKVFPDIAVFAKSISNGYPMAAIIGTANVMKVAQNTFVSSTYWTERLGPTAALATIKMMKENNVPKRLGKIGKRIKNGWSKLAKKHGLNILISGIEPLSHFDFNHKKAAVLKTLLTQKMLNRGFLASNSVYASYAHKDRYIQKYLKALDGVFEEISDIVRRGKPEKHLDSKVCHSDFKRLT